VADITDRVLLAQELEQVRAEHESQAALLLQVMKVEPQQLEGFLGVLDGACRKANAMLTAPGMTQDELRRKLNGVFRELHALKGEGTAIGLTSISTRIHAMEEILTGLRSHHELAGTDFVPLVVRLDELMTHAAAITQMQQRVASVRPALAELQAPPPDIAPAATAPAQPHAPARAWRGARGRKRQITREGGAVARAAAADRGWARFPGHAGAVRTSHPDDPQSICRHRAA
jgi:chemotaxis protein histidine kinase CheA